MPKRTRANVEIVERGDGLRSESMITPRCWRCKKPRPPVTLSKFLRKVTAGEETGLCRKCWTEIPIKVR